MFQGVVMLPAVRLIRGYRLEKFLWALCLAIAVFTAADMLLDLKQGSATVHLLVEGLLSVAALAGFVLLTRSYLLAAASARLSALRSDTLADQVLAQAEELRQWKAEARELMLGLGAAIDRQFERWRLSPAEKEVGLLLLKGLSHKEIAGVRGVSEVTIRQQGQALYKKAGVAGRHDLASFFLEDLLLPPPAQTSQEAEKAERLP